MNKTEEQLAMELDLFLNAKLKNKPVPPVSEELSKDTAFIEGLLELTSEAVPAPHFLAGLETRLAAEADRTQLRDRKITTNPERKQAQPTYWENFTQELKELFTMKRTIYAFGATLALFVFAFMAWTAFQRGGLTEPGTVAEVTVEPTPGETAEPVEIADLPPLPSLSSASGLGGGFGGGGGGDVETASNPGLDIRMYNPLSGTQFVLNATLPIEPTSAVVYQQPAGAVFTIEDASRLAAVFGMQGPVYVETYFIEEGSDWNPTPVYQVFDGTRSLGVGSNWMYFYDEASTVFTGSTSVPMPFEQALPIAEAFLQQTGLADFEYRLISPNGFDIEVHRMVDGREAIFSEMLLAVNSDGEVWSFSYNPLSGLAALGDYPLRSAEAAWQYMLDNGVDFQTVFFNSYPAENPVEQPQPVEEDFRYWQRRFEPGAEVTLYSYPGVFTAVNGDAAPRITLDLFILNGETDQLEAIAGYVGKQILVQGIAGEVVGNRQVLELVSWEPIEKEFTFIEGVVALNDGQSTLTTDEGVTYIIPDAPENLFDGDRVYINGWVEEDGQEQENIFNWQGISVVFDPQIDVEGEPEPLPIDGELVNPFGIKEVIIDQVNLQYAVLSVWDEETQTSSFTLQPVWQYKGVTDSGDLIDIYVQAAAAEYVNSTAR